MRRLFVFAFTLTLAMLAPAWGASLPDRAPFTTPITVKYLEPGVKLENALRGIAKSAGVPILLKGLPDETVVLDVKKVPFKRLLDLLVRVYAPNHAYALLPEGVLLVAPKDVVGVTPTPKPTTTTKAEAPVEGSLGVVVSARGTGEDLVATAQKLGVKEVSYVKAAQAVVLYGPASLLERVVPLLRELESRAQAQVPAPPPPPPSDADGNLPASKENSSTSASSSRLELLKAPLPKNALEALRSALELEALVDLGNDLYLLRGSETAIARAKETFSSLVPQNTSSKESTLLVSSGLSKEAAEAVAKAFGLSAFAPVGEGLYLIRGEEASVKEAKTILEAKLPVVSLLFQLPRGVSGATAKAAIEGALPGSKVTIADRTISLSLNTEKGSEEIKSLVNSLLNALVPEADPESFITKAYPIYGNSDEIAKGLEAVIPAALRAAKGYRVEVLKTQKSLVLSAPYEIHVAVVNYLKQVDPPQAAEGEGAGKVRKRVTLSEIEPKDAKQALDSAGLGVDVSADEVAKAVWIEGPAERVGRAVAYLSYVDIRPAQVKLGVRVDQVERSALSQLDPGLQAALGSLSLGISVGGISLGYSLPANVASSLALSLRSLEGRGLAKTLVDTQLLIRDGAETNLNSGGTIYVLQSSTQSSQGGSNPPAQTAQNIEYGLIVKLKPKIYKDGAVEIETGIELGGLPNQGPVANTIDVSKKKISGVLRLKETTTGLLGGLIYQEETEREQGVPVLSQIPLIGDLFKSKSSSRKESVLLVLITPVQVELPAVPMVLSLGEGAGTPGQDIKAPSLPDPRVPPQLERLPGPGDSGSSGEGKLAEPRKEGVSGTSVSTPVNPARFRPEPLIGGYVARGFASKGGYAIYVSGGSETFKAQILNVFGAYRRGDELYATALSYRASRDEFGAREVAALLVASARYDELYLEIQDSFGRRGFVRVVVQ